MKKGMTNVNRLRIIAVLSVMMFFLGNIGIVQSIGQNEKIHKNIFIEEINVSNLTKLEAKSKVKGITTLKTQASNRKVLMPSSIIEKIKSIRYRNDVSSEDVISYISAVDKKSFIFIKF